MRRRNFLTAFVASLFLKTKEKEIISALSSNHTKIKIGENALKTDNAHHYTNRAIGYRAGYANGYKQGINL